MPLHQLKELAFVRNTTQGKDANMLTERVKAKSSEPQPIVYFFSLKERQR